jgi:polyvinyl alcohol dehydrogenase (cytochrome)
MSARISVIAAAAALAIPSAALADWPVYGHDLSNTRSAGAEGPSVSQAGSLKQAWKFDSSHGDFTGTPVVAGGVLVAGSNLGTVYALDAVTGKQRWSRNVGQPINGSAAIDLDAPGGATAFVPIAQVGAPRLVALSLATGAVRWDTTLTRQEGADVFGSPTFWQGTVYIGTSGQGNDEARARGSVVALDEASGTIRWQTYMVPPGDDGAPVYSTPAIDTDTSRLYVGTGNAYHEPAGDMTDSMVALNAANGQILGHFQSVAGDVWQADSPTGPDVDFGASPNLITAPDGRLLVGEGQKSGIYWALDRATMQPAWRIQAGPGSQLDGGIDSSAYDGTRIYGGDAINGEIFALGRDGSSQWSSGTGVPLQFSPVAEGNGVLYNASSNGQLTARAISSGAVLAQISLGAPTFGGVSIVGRALYAAIGTGPPSPAQPIPGIDTSQIDGNGSIVAFGDTSESGARPAAPRTQRRRASHRPRHRARRANTRRHRQHRHHRHRSQRGRPGTGAQPSVAPHPLTFTGSCDFAGSVYFQPPLTNTPQDVGQRVELSGPCTGTLVDAAGQEQQLNDTTVYYHGVETATSASCLGGVATGTVTLVFPYGTIATNFTERRAAAIPVVELDGTSGGAMWGIAYPSSDQDPLAAVQACGGAGMREFKIQAHAQTTPSISG